MSSTPMQPVLPVRLAEACDRGEDPLGSGPPCSSPAGVAQGAPLGSVRRCGSCNACCTHLPIPEGLVSPGAKPAGIPCPHVGARGCRVYARRPRMCVEFACAWFRDPTWPAAWRPDRSGLMCLREMLEPGLPAAAVYEIAFGALDRPENCDILSELRATTAVIAEVDLRRRSRRVLGTWSPPPQHASAPASVDHSVATGLSSG